jgi:hypothetical protein
MKKKKKKKKKKIAFADPISCIELAEAIHGRLAHPIVARSVSFRAVQLSSEFFL